MNLFCVFDDKVKIIDLVINYFDIYENDFNQLVLFVKLRYCCVYCLLLWFDKQQVVIFQFRFLKYCVMCGYDIDVIFVYIIYFYVVL